ncbi:hypothetical protein HS088_TW15G00755 [Tripterygium wilfordii]|uniref:Pentatricopeptide repeat-containing protein n=1 Tax=Tripterygium wilfordii TaxID=458696 RepID=A0A7J7CMH1_TRIWF|nr:hypothetical protein HS088_TW15G00755 [Tripterygium wilfordii]
MGLDFFNEMVNEYQAAPDINHYGCFVGMLGRARRLEEAKKKMALEITNEIVNDVIWRTLLGAFTFHGTIEMDTRKTMEMECQVTVLPTRELLDARPRTMPYRHLLVLVFQITAAILFYYAEVSWHYKSI